VVAFFATLEIVTRTAGPPPHPLLEADATRMWRLRPHLDTEQNGTIVTNADGWRNREEIPREKPPGSLRVVCVGDSWMFGFRASQDDTIPAVLAVDLRQRLAGRTIQVINGGVFGYGPGQTLATLREAMAWHPDVVVVGLLHNTNAQVASMRAAPGWQTFVRSLLLRSRFYLWLRLALQDRLHEANPSAVDRRLWADTHDDYADMADLAKQAGALCVFLDYRLPPDDWPQVHKVEKPGNHVESPFEAQMAIVAREKGCVLVPCSYFYEADGTQLTDLANDKYHPSAKGYHWIAAKAARAIVDNLPR
jgi:lysophospholipase L1-like esterase